MNQRAIGAAAAGVALLAGAYLVYRPAGAVGLENGAFANDCCGTLELRDGAMRLNGKQTVRYAVGRDSRGPYVLPRTYVGAFLDRGIEVDGTRPTTRLRLDRLPAPESIVLYEGQTPYVFRREARRVRDRPAG
jgi:hypothetical protein